MINSISFNAPTAHPFTIGYTATGKPMVLHGSYADDSHRQKVNHLITEIHAMLQKMTYSGIKSTNRAIVAFFNQTGSKCEEKYIALRLLEFYELLQTPIDSDTLGYIKTVSDYISMHLNGITVETLMDTLKNYNRNAIGKSIDVLESELFV